MKGILLVAAIHVLILHQAQKRKASGFGGATQQSGLLVRQATLSNEKVANIDHHPRMFWGVITN